VIFEPAVVDMYIPEEFAEKWMRKALSDRQRAQLHAREQRRAA